MGERYFTNPFDDYKPGDTVNIDKTKILNLITNYVQQIIENFPPNKHEDAELYVGSAGIAFMFLHLSKSNQIPESFQSIDYANKYINMAKQKQIRNPKEYCGFLCGSAGIHAVAAGIAAATRHSDQELITNEIKLFEKGFDICLQEFSRTGCDELFVGRAGYLNGCYWLNEQFPNKKPISAVKMIEICNKIVESGRNYSKANKSQIPLMYNYHGTEYLGAAHGICSIYLMLLNSPWFQDEDSTFPNISKTKLKDIRDSIDAFVDLQTLNGNFPVKTVDQNHRHREKQLIHWCHGAPGAIYLLLKAYHVFKDERYLDSAKRAADLIWSYGLLKKGPGICHGVAGNGYAFLCLYRLTNDQKYLYRSNCFMEFLTDEQFLRESNQPDRPYSLYEGIAGTVCYLVDLLQPDKAEFPFFHIV